MIFAVSKNFGFKKPFCKISLNSEHSEINEAQF